MRSAAISFVSLLLVGVVATASCSSAATEAGPPAGAPAAVATPAAEPAASTSPASQASAPPLVQPGAPGAPSRVISAENATDLSGVGHTAADVQFMQGMIHHHAQALDMVALMPSRTEREDMLALGKRIRLSQEDEIKMMQNWLELRGETAPGMHDHDRPGSMLMPGMLSAEEMERLAAATGPEFDRLFLQFMVKHHEGALIMVDDLFAKPGAGQESVIFAFASEVVADQSAEIGRMNAMLNAMRKE